MLALLFQDHRSSLSRLQRAGLGQFAMKRGIADELRGVLESELPGFIIAAGAHCRLPTLVRLAVAMRNLSVFAVGRTGLRFLRQTHCCHSSEKNRVGEERERENSVSYDDKSKALERENLFCLHHRSPPISSDSTAPPMGKLIVILKADRNMNLSDTIKNVDHGSVTALRPA
ncbi:hypothetical protein [Bradyrhizobium cenepequi]|uniref:hypothetical protein n=1 Tax=Bradyrhizobium cenepequi TaxID=2821403 RepID=UPI001CE324DE|nr:hypothetical protein [Bradyrhizobium cenepequi]MCA6108160.1 hypothetical protein [Bradyrhizobium cenepequi]